MDSSELKEILVHNSDISKKISLCTIKIQKTEKFNGQEYVLLSIPRIDIFTKLKIISDAKLRKIKESNERALNKSHIDRFIALEPIVETYSELASLAQYKEFLISTYSATAEFDFLKDTKKEYDDLKNSINVYILTDVNSRIFSNSIKKAFKEKGFTTLNSVKLLIASKTEDSKDYTFSKDKKKISSRQHTFIGKKL